MTFADLQTEIIARGAQNDATRNGRWLNLAYHEIANAYDWPFTEVTATGASGAGVVAVADVRKVIVVGDVSGTGGLVPGRKLRKITFTELAEEFDIENVAQAGTSEYWWHDPTAGQIKTYPLGGTIYVRYYKRLVDLSGSLVPVFDAEYHNLIVDRAMVEVYKDTPEFDLVQPQLQDYLVRLGRMAQDYQVLSREHSYIQVVNPYDG